MKLINRIAKILIVGMMAIVLLGGCSDGIVELDAYSERGGEIQGVTIQLSNEQISVADERVTVQNKQITITAAGTYQFRGQLSEGQIVVAAKDSDRVQIILAGVDIDNSSSAPIYIKQADEVLVTLAEDTENLLTAGGEFVETDEDKIDAAIFSKTDLSLNGQGKLMIITNYGHGIVSKDDLVIMEGDYDIMVSGHGLSGKDSVRIEAGTIVISAGKDGIHSQNSDDQELGIVYIKDGEINISAESDGIDGQAQVRIDNGNLMIRATDDGIHANQNLTVNEGRIIIDQSYEGLEAEKIVLNGGQLSILASDDGINAVANVVETADLGKSGSEPDSQSVYLEINGGTIEIDANGDGIDTNGNLYVNGGQIYISGPTNDGNGALDYDGEAVITGGTIVAVGSAGMAQNFGANSEQAAMLISVNGQTAGAITVTDDSGTVIAEYTPTKSYASVLISSPELEVGKAYKVITGKQSQMIEFSQLLYGQAGGRQGHGGQMVPSEEAGTLPPEDKRNRKR